MSNFNLYIPSCFYINILQNNKNNLKGYYLYLYNTNYYIIFHLLQQYELNIKKNIFINKHTNTILLNSFFNDAKLKTLNTNLYYFLFSIEYVFYKKLKFTGKGFKIKKKKNNIILYFNTAHINLLILKNNITQKLAKNKYIILKSNNYHNYCDSYLFKSVKLNNIFTKRGLRFTRQIIFKKKGKN
jgi:hypothetical protein